VLPLREKTEMNRTFASLLLSAVIALPAFAHQVNSSSNTQSPAAADQTTSASQNVNNPDREPLREIHGDFWDGDEPGIAWLLLHPFASKGYVQRQTAPIGDRLNELEEITASNGKAANDFNTRSQQGLQLASDKTKEADQNSTNATNKAQLAQQTVSGANTHLSSVENMVGGLDQYEAGTQTVIRLHPGQSVLSKDAKRALDEMATQLQGQHGYVVEVHGYVSEPGQAAVASSRKMADLVVRYLVLNHEIPAYRIYEVGMGNAPRARGEENVAKRNGSRVEVSVLKNNLNQVASPSSGASTPQ